MLSNKSEIREALGLWAENQDGDDCEAQSRLHLCTVGETAADWLIPTDQTAAVNRISDLKRKPRIKRRHFTHNIDYLK